MKITDEMLREAAPGACALWLASYPDPAPHHTFSPGFERKIEELADHPHRRVRLRTLLIAAVITALTVMTVGADVVPPVRAFRSGVVDVLSQVLPKSTDQIYTTDADHEGPTRRPVLGWLPEGMVETKRTELTNITRINYENADGDRLSIYTKRITEDSANTVSIDTEDAEVSKLILHNNPATMAVEDGRTLIEFFIDNYNCSVIGTIPTEQVLKVAEHIELK